MPVASDSVDATQMTDDLDKREIDRDREQFNGQYIHGLWNVINYYSFLFIFKDQTIDN